MSSKRRMSAANQDEENRSGKGIYMDRGSKEQDLLCEPPMLERADWEGEIRYAWQPYVRAGLYNSAGLCAKPFRVHLEHP